MDIARDNAFNISYEIEDNLQQIKKIHLKFEEKNYKLKLN